jgi:hypothetical protein
VRENRTHGSEGGEDGVLLYPYHVAKRIALLIHPSMGCQDKHAGIALLPNQTIK